MEQIRRRTLNGIPTEKEIDMLLDKGYEVEVYMRDGEIIIETDESP